MMTKKEIIKIYRINLTSFIVIFISTIAFAQTNVQNEIEVHNTSLFLAHRKTSRELTNGKDFFKPYLSFYNNQTQNYEDILMDSFVFSDFTVGMEGEFDLEIQSFYLDNVFKRTKTPILGGGKNKFGIIDQTHTSALSYKNLQRLSNENSFTLSFDISVLAPQISDSINYDEILIGIEYYDINGNEIIESYGNQTFSEYIDMLFIGGGVINTTTNGFTNISKVLNFPPEAVKFNIHILNWNLANISKIGVDNVSLITNSGIQKIDSLDMGFNQSFTSTKWEYNPYLKFGDYLFKNRNALIDQLNEANSDLGIIPVTKLILLIPELNKDNYNSQAEKSQLILQLENYIDEIEYRYNNWNQNGAKKVEIIGLYYFGEAIHDRTAGNEGRIAFVNEILTPIKAKLHSKNWKLFGSPYHLFECSGGSTSFDDQTIIELFDVMWQQPNSFYKSHWGELDGNIDRELLRRANKIMSNKKLNVNIENRVLVEGEHYGRINDYFDYGDKYGYTNYSKLYYDDAGAHYVNAKSNNPKERVDYDNLYKYILKSRKGEVINNKFEVLDEVNTSKFHYWDGTYHVKKNIYSFNDYRDLEFITSSSDNLYSELIPINNLETYNMSFEVKQDFSGQLSNNNALVGIQFYDNNGYLLNLNLMETDLDWSSYLNSYYKYFNTTTTYNQFSIYFTPPIGAVSFRFFLRKWKNVNIQWKSLKLYSNNDLNKSRIIYKTDILSTLNVENKIEYGNNSLELKLNEFTITKEKISITPNTNYNLKISAREKLPYIDTRYNKALIAIEMFDSNGQKIDRTLGDFIYSASLDMRFRYVTVSPDGSEFIKTFQFANDVASIKIYLRNWAYNNSIFFDNISLELSTSPDLNRHLNKDNLLSRNTWNEKLPLRISSNASAYYNDFINVENVSNLNFSALIRGSETYPTDWDLLAIEFYDENYSLLLENDISNVIGFNYSENYKYWYKNNLTLEYIECENFPPNNPEVLDAYWYENQWKNYSQEINIPIEASYIKVYFHKIDGQNEFLVLNPQLVEIINGPLAKTKMIKGKEVIEKETVNENSLTNDNFQLYPNPTSTLLNIDFNEDIINNLNLTIYAMDGRRVESKLLKEKNNLLDISNLASGVYLVLIKNGTKSYFKKLIIK
jgi:hypothetical protein